ncbi:MAG TPA: hypothetical protein VLN59_17410 [Burkholderiales bacterium]|nr:hypothetical protein [Burkholderiales bacterium]
MFVTGLGTVVPGIRYTQAQWWDALRGSHHFARLDRRARAMLEKVLLGDSGIRTRHLALDPLEEAFEDDADTLHRRFSRHAPRLAAEAAAKALREAGERAADVDALLVNLFLHHFDGQPLRQLLRLVQRRTRVFVACEPRRAPLPLATSRLLGLIGCNGVSRHDALASVRGGFRAAELSELWGNRDGWSLREQSKGPFSHVFIASRCAGRGQLA